MIATPAGSLELVSAALAAVAGWLLVLDDDRLSRPPGIRLRLRLRPLGALGAAAAGVVAIGLVNPLLVVNGLVGVVVAAVVAHLVAQTRRRTAAAQRRLRVLALCDALVAELRSGQSTLSALERVAEEWDELTSVASAARMGADVPTALRSTAALPGAEALSEVAAAWQVSARSGAGLAEVLERMGAAVREQEDVARESAAALAPARATAHLLGVLPLVGLALGTALGGDPLHVLFATPVGTALLALGAALALTGVLWVERLVTTAAG